MSKSVRSSDIFIDAEEYVKQYFCLWLPATRHYHGLSHTSAVVEKCELLAAHYEIPWSDAEALFLAAWFHDIGYCKSSDDHEQKSIVILSNFLEDYNISTEFTAQVERLINATRVDDQPVTLLEKIIRDADLHHLGTSEYLIWAQMLKQELELCDGKKFSEKEWAARNIEFFKTHHFQTDHAITLWNDQKNINLQMLIKSLC